MNLLGTNQKTRTLWVVVIGGVVVVGLWLGKPRPEMGAPSLLKPPTVEVMAADPRERILTVETQGTVRPLREIKLVSQVGGLVKSASPNFASGGFFAAGEQLLRIEDVDYQFAIARAEAQVAAASQGLAEERGRALQAKREWRELGSEQANALFLRKPQLASAQAALTAAQADLAAANMNLARTVISAPFNGRISEKFVDIGQFISPGTAVATVYDTDVAQVRLPLTDRQIALLDLPLGFDDSSPRAFAYPNVLLKAEFANRTWEWRGRIVRTDASIDVASRVIYAVAEIDKPFAPDPDSERPPLYPGLFVNATISGKRIQGVSVLPGSAVRGDSTVLIVDGRSRAVSRQVEILASTREQTWLRGLKAEELVVIGEGSSSLAGLEVSINRVEEVHAGEDR